MSVKVVGVAVHGGHIHLYMQDGTSHREAAEAWRVKVVQDSLVPALTRYKVVDFDLASFALEAEFQKLTGGRIKLGWEKVKNFMGFSVTNTQIQRDATILAGLSSEEHKRSYGHVYGVDRASDHMVATVGGKRIPGVEHMSKHMEHAVATGSSVGLENFLARIAKVIEDRHHSIEELLHFMSRADLPLAEDGTILAYKVLKTKGAVYVDCHTGKIEQSAGCIVRMDESKVDPSRRVECSTGFHIARRGYLRSFSGDVCVLTKVAPEHVIAVPRNEPNKMRVSEYEIVFPIPDKGYRLLRENRPMTSDPVSAKLLHRASVGDHPAAKTIVEVGVSGKVSVTYLDSKSTKPAQVEKTRQDKRAHALDDQSQGPYPAKTPAKVINEAADAEEKATKYHPPANMVVEYGELLPDQKKALDLRQKGVSQREIEKRTGVSRKSQWRLAKKGF